jgi:hypothetical protein
MTGDLPDQWPIHKPFHVVLSSVQLSSIRIPFDPTLFQSALSAVGAIGGMLEIT